MTDPQSNIPTLSLLIIGYNMPSQLQNSLHTLSTNYQRQVSPLQYEVVIIENESDNCLPLEYTNSLPSNFHYHKRPEVSHSPVNAINEGFSLLRGEYWGLMIDGAHLLSPSVIKYALLSYAIDKNAFTTVPVYHLGPKEQHLSSQEGYNETAERNLLSTINWQDNGYELFTVSSRCSANERGFFAPIMESNCYFAPKDHFTRIGYADNDFQLPGGGSINLHITRALGTLPGSHLFTLGGEGSFHQYHGGITSSQHREAVVKPFYNQLHAKWEGKFNFLAKNPTILGNFPAESQAQLLESSEFMSRRFQICVKNNWTVWPDEH